MAALVFGSRLAGNLGGTLLGYALALRAERLAQMAPDGTTAADRANAALFHAYQVQGRRGPLATDRLLQRRSVREALAGAAPSVSASVLCLQAQISAAFRDTDAAEALWQEACALDPSAWIYTQRTTLLILADRYPEALQASHEALRQRPWYRPAIQHSAQALTLLGRDEEAFALLTDALDPAGGNLESGAVAAQLANLAAELRRPHAVLEALARAEALHPLEEEKGRQWLASRRAESLLQLGDLLGSADAAEPLVATVFFYAKTVPRLRDPERQSAARVVHAVPFVRQHERTCAPATLAALTQFWGRPAEQAAIAAEICYGGTFDHEERHWAQSHGWETREFRIDWPGAVALLDAGIPFTVATTGVNSGHLQAVIGYDARRGTLIIRDPYERNQSEALAEEFLERFASSGPRGLAIVPAADAGAVDRLRAIDLAETALHDALYCLRRALHRHDRAAARTALDDLNALDPGARLTLTARRELAIYDGDDASLLPAIEGLLALHPDEGRLRLEKLHVLGRLARPVEAREWLETCAADPKRTEPHIWRELARGLNADARQRPRARRLLSRCLFYEPAEPEHLRGLGELLWSERNFAQAAVFFRRAATAALTREDCWQQYFVVSRHLQSAEEAFALLEARFRRLGDLSWQPAATLHWARRERHEFTRAAAVLEEALRRRPEDGDLLLFAGSVRARDGEHEAAADFLARARDCVAPGAYARAAAEAAGLAGDSRGALAQWQAVLEREPLNVGAHRAAVRLLEEIDPRGPLAARDHLAAAIQRFPHAVGLHELRVEALAEEPGRGTPEHASAVAALLAVQPGHVWALRERAIGCQSLLDLPGAFAAVEEAARLDPLAPSTHALRGRLLLVSGDPAEGATAVRRALELDPDLPGALAFLLECSPTLADKRAALDFTHDLLTSQPWVGNGIAAYREAAYPILPEPELQAQLEAILAARPDLWQAWSAAVWQHANAGRLAPAHAGAASAAERFPLLPSVWLDLAAIEKLRDDDPAQIAALERALRIRAANGEASRRLALVHRRAGHFAEAREALEKAIAAAPLDVANRGALAETLWHEDRPRNGPEALRLLVDAVTREPGYVWGWDALRLYADALGERTLSEDTARALSVSRPGEARSWLRLASSLKGRGGPELEERLSALDRALALNPRLDDAHDLRAHLLTFAGRFEEALAACAPPAEAYPGNTRPPQLEVRAAWVIATRGDLDGARERIRRLLADQPGYEAAWRLLAEWSEAAGDFQENLTAAERLAFLSPHAAMPMGYLASARLRLKRPGAAKEALVEAMRRDPSYLYAPATLLDLQVEHSEWSGAEKTLAFLQTHHPGASTLSRAVMLAAKRRDKSRACKAFDQLVGLAPIRDADPAALTSAVESMENAYWARDAENSLAAAWLAPETANPEAGALWVRLRAARSKWWGLGAKIRRLPAGEFARRARIAYLSVVAKQGRGLDCLWFIWRLGGQLRVETESWGQAGYALTSRGYYGWAIRWLSDWETRPEVQGWMLFNLAVALRAIGRHRQALAVNRAALRLPPDHTRAKQLAWVTLEDALSDGEEALAQATRQEEELSALSGQLDQPFRYVAALAGSVLAVRAPADLAARRGAYREARRTVREARVLAVKSLRLRSAAIRHAERRARLRLARDAGIAWRRWLVWLFSAPGFGAGRLIFVVAWAIVALTLLGIGILQIP